MRVIEDEDIHRVSDYVQKYIESRMGGESVEDTEEYRTGEENKAEGRTGRERGIGDGDKPTIKDMFQEVNARLDELKEQILACAWMSQFQKWMLVNVAKEDRNAMGEDIAESADNLHLAITNMLDAIGITREERDYSKGTLDFASDPSAIEIKTLDISVRLLHGLWRSGIKTVGDILLKSPKEIKKIRLIGAKTHRELMAKMESILEKDVYDEWAKKDAKI